MHVVRTVVIGVTGVAFLAALAIPSFAAMQSIADEELDGVTAAGQPKKAKAFSVTGTATALVQQDNLFTALLSAESQTNLRALSLNNVIGENQLANAVNIQASVDIGSQEPPLFGDGTSEGWLFGQENEITQSWGSLDEVALILPGAAAASCENATSTICKAAGGSADTSVVLRNTADEIVIAESQDDAADAMVDVMTDIVADISDTAQMDLSALHVNNVFGLNQVANALNIGGEVNAASGVLSVTSGGGLALQSNTIYQYRGTPKL